MTMDITDYYLANRLPRTEYMQIHSSVIPEEIIQQYKLRENNLIDDRDFTYVAIDGACMDFPKLEK